MNYRKRSDIWNLFNCNNGSTATCNICSKHYSFKGGSTSNLYRHINTKHPESLSAIGKISKKASNQSYISLPKSNSDDETSSTKDIQSNSKQKFLEISWTSSPPGGFTSKSEQLFNISFVGEVEKYPCLYNNNLPEYQRKDITDEAWDEIGRTFQLAGSDCKDRFKKLKETFVSHMKPGGSKVKTNYLADPMMFLAPYLKINNKNNSGDISDTPCDEDPLDTEIFMVDAEEDRVKTRSFTGPPSPQKNLYVYPKKTQRLLPSSAAPRQTFMRRRRVNESRYEYSADTTNDNDSPPNESRKLFLLSLLPEIEEMTDQQAKVFKRLVFQLIDEITNNVQVTAHFVTNNNAAQAPVQHIVHQSSANQSNAGETNEVTYDSSQIIVEQVKHV